MVSVSATYELELDTTPPRVEFERPRWRDDGLDVVFTLSEPEIVSAEFNGTPLVLGPDRFSLPPQLKPGLVVIRTRDDVLNEAEWTLRIPATAAYVDGGESTYNDGGDSTYFDGGESTYDG